ncbi:cartilage matrix protein-like isoform X2 [Haliotis rubra]|uniref:cartilage matrix protein-like isoform X2 n=1 Tax=Haliotis rubra TaxID=36100 RepID=UPI001EE59E00|nr:cartilage matrix protein-like isoform X2 [Haliotis rubra]
MIRIATCIVLCVALTGCNGVLQEAVCQRGVPADVVFLLDSSNSIWGPDFLKQLEFVGDVVSMFQIGQQFTRVAIATFGRYTETQFHLDDYFNKEDMIDAILNIKETNGDATNTAQAIRYMRRKMFNPRHGGRRGVSRVGIVVTDGQSHNILKTVWEASKAKKQNINMFALGVGSMTNLRELKGISSKPSIDYYFQVGGYSALDNLKEKLALRTCQVTGPPEKTTRAVPKAPTTIRTTTTTPPTTTTYLDVLQRLCLNKKADIVFALDSSNQISTQDFWNQIRFVREFAKNLDIGPNKTRVGLIVYTDQVLEGFELNTYQDVHDVTTGLLAVERSAGGTRIGEAVRYIRTKSFRRSLARRNVAQIGVILAASQSYNIGRTKKEADMARKSGIKLFAIGAGDDVNDEEMQVLTNGQEGRSLFRLDSFENLQDIIPEFTTDACTVEPSTFPVADQPCGFRQEADLMFVLDSVNAGRTNTKKSLEFIKSIARAVDIDKDKVQIGLMSAECQTPTEGFSLNRHGNKKSLVNALSEMKGTDFSSLLKDMRRSSFNKKKGGRYDAKKVAVLIVDGNLEQPLKALREARHARVRGVEVYVVQVGNGMPQREMKMMCDAPSQQHFFQVENYDELKGLQNQLLDILCDEL